MKYVIYTHNHYDHTLGGKIFKDAGAKFVSQENCIDEFRRHPNPALVMPDETYKDKRDLTLGDLTDFGGLDDLPIPEFDFWRVTGGVTIRF